MAELASDPWAEPFAARVGGLPTLGLGVSTEFGANAGRTGLDPLALAAEHPEYAAFLEIGLEVAKGLDADAEAWLASGRPCTYHFLDLDLDDPADLDARWLAGARAWADRLKPAWICGDAGTWHFGRRAPQQMLLLPPILRPEVAQAMARGVVALRAALGREVFPENPPGVHFFGPLHLLEFYAALTEAADTGLLLDCAHLAMFQRSRGLEPLAGLANFPLERIVELHVAGGTVHERDGARWIDDDHGPTPLPETWAIFDWVVERAPNLKAVVFECERNPAPAALPGFARLYASLGPRWAGSAPPGAAADSRAVAPGVDLPPQVGASGSLAGDGDDRLRRREVRAVAPHPPAARGSAASEPELGPSPALAAARALQRAWLRLNFEPELAQRWFATPARLERRLGLDPAGVRELCAVDPRLLAADPDRAGRLLKALIEALPVASALALASPRGRELGLREALTGEHAAAYFHPGALAVDVYGRWLARTLELGRARATRAARELAELERRLAVASTERRWAIEPPPGSEAGARGAERLGLGRGVALIEVRAAVAEAYEALRPSLVADVAAVLKCAERVAGAFIDHVDRGAPGRLALLAVVGPTGATLERLRPGLASLLGLAARTATRAELGAAACAEGLAGPDADALLDELLCDGVLEPAAAPGPG